MIHSMTGYGKAHYESEQLFLSIEIKSVNHRFSEIAVRMPNGFLELEELIRNQVKKRINRGKVDVFVIISGENLLKRDLHVDWTLMTTYVNSLQRAKSMYDLPTELSLDHLLQLPELFTVVASEGDNDELEEVMTATCNRAIDELKKMRVKEGKVLYDNLHDRLDRMRKILHIIDEQSPRILEKMEERLLQKMQAILNEITQFDESRLLSEVAILADKTNIEEELVRLKSHLEQFYSILNSGGQVGRKLDFLAQEMNREINTIGSKANDVVISRKVVELKNELEMVREQIQNIE